MEYFNTDESLLDDKERPRDEYWFRLEPGRQMDKWKLRNSNKSLVDYFSICWWKEVTWTTTADMRSSTAVKIPLLTNNRWKFTMTETYPYSEEQLEWYAKTIKMWDSSWWNKEWRVYIPETWIYMIQYFVQFIWIDWTTMPTSATESPKLMVQLDAYEADWRPAWPADYIYWWWLVQPDVLVWLNLNACWKWESLWLSALHSRNWTKAFCFWCIKIQKLS